MAVHAQVYFSPRGGCLGAIVKELLAARSEVLVQAYSFSSVQIGDALIDCHKRGLKVQLLLDEGNEGESYSELWAMQRAGVPTLIDDKHAISHNKIILVDQHVIITGSFNFSHQAENNNSENLLVIRGHVELMKCYRANFLNHQAHSRPAAAGLRPKPAVLPMANAA